MTKSKKRNRLKNSGKEGRCTPRDLEIRGTIFEPPEVPKEPPRPPTPQETHANNISMVEFGRMMMSLGRWAPLFRTELKDMNRGKVGRPYDFSDSLIFWMMQIMAMTGLSFRLTAGMTGPLLGLLGLPAPSYSRLQERVSAIGESIAGSTVSDSESRYGKGILALVVCDNVTVRTRRVGVDSTGLNLSDTTMWRLTKWDTGPKKRGWLKLHALSDVDSGEILAYAVTDDSVGDTPMLRTLVREASEAGHVFGTVYADGAYSSDRNWIYLCRENGYRFITSFKSNTVPKNNGSAARGRAARLWCSLPYREWVEVSGYGTRWKVECVFSDLKRIFGETVTARKKENMVAQIVTKIESFNRYKAMRAGILRITGNQVSLV